MVAKLETPPSGARGILPGFIQFFAQGETNEFSSTAFEPNRRATIRADLSPPAAAPVPLTPAPNCAPPAQPGDLRALDLQPVFLRKNPKDASPTGDSWARRFNEANVIWGKLGVTFVELPPITIDTPLKTANGDTLAERAQIRALHSGPGIEVFLVDNNMKNRGGAATTPGCGNTGQMVMSDKGSSDTLLAHELGHTLFDTKEHAPTVGDLNTIMEPSGSNNSPNSRRNTMANYALITCPAPSGAGCLNPDP